MKIRDAVADMPPDLRDTKTDDIGKQEIGKPGSPEARDECKLGNFYTESMIYEYAIDAYKRAIRIEPDYAVAHHNLGAVYYKLGLFDEAKKEIESAIKLRPDTPLFHYTLGLVLKDDKKLSECIASFSSAISLSPDYIEAYYRRGLAYFYTGDLEKACSDLETVVKLDPGFRDAQFNLGVVYISLERWESARDVFLRQITLKPDDPDLFYYMALVYVKGEKNIDKAIESLQSAIYVDPEHSRARFLLALLYSRLRYKDPSLRQKAIEQLQTLTKEDNVLEDFDRAHDAFFLLGSLYDDDPNDADLAISAYEKGLRVASWSASAHNNLGVLYSKKGLIDKAIKEFREAIRLDPDYESPYHNLAKIYFYQQNEEIIKDFRRWIEEAGEESAKILFNLSLALMDVGRSEACERIYSKAHKIKNLIGVAGSKLRHLSKQIDNAELMEILTDQEKCYDEMVNLLSSLKQEDMVLDMVDVSGVVRSALLQMGFKPDEQAGSEALWLGNVSCITDLAEDLPEVKGDLRKLKEAFSNIIINALEAMNGRGVLRISTEYSESASGVEIIFRDTGTGIPVGELDNVLKPGYTTKETGSGFGLSIVNRIISEHKGNIRISSREGEGTEVRLYLPVNLELAPIQTSLRMRPVVFEDSGKLISTEVDQIVSV